MLDKVMKHAFGKDVYLLGIDHDGIYHWLEAPSWDCGWYWGFGYIEAYTNNKYPHLSRDNSEHTHWDSLFMHGNKNSYDTFKEYFAETTVSNDELWQLCDLMATFYTLQKTAEVFHSGNSHYTSKAKLSELIDEQMVERINKVMLPAIFAKIKDILKEAE